MTHGRGPDDAHPARSVRDLWNDVNPDGRELVPCVVQDVRSRAVLMVAWVNLEALLASIESGFATYWSRSRQTLWEKGASSGNRQRLLHVRLDCDGDTLLYLVDPVGPACHEGTDTCFSKQRVGMGWRWAPEDVLRAPGVAPRSYWGDLERLLDARVAAAPGEHDEHTRVLAAGGVSAQAAQIKDDAEYFAHVLATSTTEHVAEAAGDLLYTLAIALRGRNVRFDDVVRSVRRHRVEEPDPVRDAMLGPPSPDEAKEPGEAARATVRSAKKLPKNK